MACFEAFFTTTVIATNQEGKVNRHGTHTNSNETESGCSLRDVHGQEFHMQMIYSKGREKKTATWEQSF